MRPEFFSVLREADDFEFRSVLVHASELTNEDYTAMSDQEMKRADAALKAIGVVVVWSEQYGFELVDASDYDNAVAA